MRIARIINIFLIVLVTVLILNLLEPNLTGSLVSSLQADEPVCAFHNDGISLIPTDRCCYEITKQRTCIETDNVVFPVRCYTSEDSHKYFMLNTKQFNTCQKEGYDVSLG